MHHHTKEAIHEATALPIRFINHASSRLSDLLEPYRIRSDKGKLLYNNDGLRIWDVIAQHKRKGENIKQIREAVTTITGGEAETRNSALEPLQTEPETTPDRPDNFRYTIEAIKESYKETIAEKERTILMLTSGQKQSEEKLKQRDDKIIDLKTELQISIQERERKARQRAILIQSLENLPVFSSKYSSHLIPN